MLSPVVTASKIMANSQCKNKAGVELCSSVFGERVDSEREKRLRIHAYGVVTLRAKKSVNGKIPSFAISCLTCKWKWSQQLSRDQSFQVLLTFTCGECGDEEVTKNRECNDSGHNAFCNLITESPLEKQSGHVEVLL